MTFTVRGKERCGKKPETEGDGEVWRGEASGCRGLRLHL